MSRFKAMAVKAFTLLVKRVLALFGGSLASLQSSPLGIVRSLHLPLPHREAWPFLAGTALAFVVGLLVASWLAWLGLIGFLLCLFFFRDPERTTLPQPLAVVAAADGRVISVAALRPPTELGLGEAPRWRVATFLSVLNVHVNRIPVDGTIVRVAYRPGRFHNAGGAAAGEANERNGITVRMADGTEVAVVQIAGMIARRIVCAVREGDQVARGSRFGMIRFGSRTDIYLPEGVHPMVTEGQTMVGGETVVALLPLPA